MKDRWHAKCGRHCIRSHPSSPRWAPPRCDAHVLVSIRPMSWTTSFGNNRLSDRKHSPVWQQVRASQLSPRRMALTPLRSRACKGRRLDPTRAAARPDSRRRPQRLSIAPTTPTRKSPARAAAPMSGNSICAASRSIVRGLPSPRRPSGSGKQMF
jgi:hypothetical protein